MRLKAYLLAAFVVTMCSAAPARADWLFTPFVGGNIGGDTVGTQLNAGVSAAWMSAGVVGFEFDAAWAPDFFDTGAEEPFRLVTDSSVSTYMFNAMFAAPAGQSGRGARPYVALGIGAIRSRVESDLGLVDIKNTDLGWNAGGGVMGFVSDRVGLRGDLRYLGTMRRDLEESPLTEDLDRFGFWRLTGGVTLRWGNGSP